MGKGVHLAARWCGERYHFHTRKSLLSSLATLITAWWWVTLLASNDKTLWGSLTLISVLWSPLLSNYWYCIYPRDLIVIPCWALGRLLCWTAVPSKVTLRPCDVLLVSSPTSTISYFPHPSEKPENLSTPSMSHAIGSFIISPSVQY